MVPGIAYEPSIPRRSSPGERHFILDRLMRSGRMRKRHAPGHSQHGSRKIDNAQNDAEFLQYNVPPLRIY
jgi:hypothetical protein